MSNNDISIRPAKHEIMVGDSLTIKYIIQTVPDTRSQYHVRRTQAHVLRAPSTTIWPGSHIDVTLLRDVPPEEIVAVEQRSECRYTEEMWPKPTIVNVVAGKIRLVIDSSDPKQLRRNEHFCQAILTTTVADTAPKTSDATVIMTPPRRGHNQ